jgi:Flp pilus assembly protein TadB
MHRRHYIAVRVFLALGIVLVGVTLHHHGTAYDAIRGVYLIVIVALIVWRINNRRQRRRLSE